MIFKIIKRKKEKKKKSNILKVESIYEPSALTDEQLHRVVTSKHTTGRNISNISICKRLCTARISDAIPPLNIIIHFVTPPPNFQISNIISRFCIEETNNR